MSAERSDHIDDPSLISAAPFVGPQAVVPLFQPFSGLFAEHGPGNIGEGMIVAAKYAELAQMNWRNDQPFRMTEDCAVLNSPAFI